MKTIKHTLICLLAIVLCQCSDYHDIPGKVPYTVTTLPAEEQSYTLATVSYKVNAPYANPEGVKGGVMWGTSADLSNSQIVYSERNYGRTIHLSDLSPETTYYYMGFIEDELGNQIKGEVLSFVTGKVYVTTLAATQVSESSADARYEVYGAPQAKGGICLGKSADLSDAKTIYSTMSNGNYVRTITLQNLESGVEYFYAGFIEDNPGNKRMGNTVSFVTIKNKVFLWTQIPNSRLSSAEMAFASRDYIYCSKDINQLWMYDPQSSQWEQKSNIPQNGIIQSVYHPDRRVYSILLDNKGDWNDANDTYDLWVYYEYEDSWSHIGAVPISAYFLSPIFLYEERIYVMDKNWSIWEYDIAKDNWQQCANGKYPGRATHHTCLSWFSYNNKVYMGLGSTYQSPSYICYNDFWVYDVAALSWTRLADAPSYRVQIGWTSFELDGKGYVITIQDEFNSRSNNSLVYDILKKTWSFIDDYADLSFNNHSGYSARVKDRIYVFSGTDKSYGGFWKFR